MTMPLKIHHAMKALRDARDLLEASATQSDNPAERIGLDSVAEDIGSLLLALELDYGELPQ